MDNDNEFLEEMQNDKYVNQIELDKQQEKEDKIQDKIDKKKNKLDSKINKAQKLEEKQLKIEEKNKEKQENKINESTDIISKNKRSLLNKINKYKKIYKTQLLDYKIMKNATEDELKIHIINMEDILDSSEVDNIINWYSIGVFENKLYLRISLFVRFKNCGFSLSIELSPVILKRVFEVRGSIILIL